LNKRTKEVTKGLGAARNGPRRLCDNDDDDDDDDQTLTS